MASESDSLGLVGTTIAEKYAVESVVGEGGFATVYRAMHTLWNRPVAVKVFRALGEVAASERQKLLDDFIQEGRLLADLSERSTAICQARDIGTLKTPGGDQVPYMVLEWLEGQPLESLIEHEVKAGAPLRTLEQTIRLLDPVAEALALAHRKGIVHRDVKPANVFVLGDPRSDEVGVKLLDFGIAKVVQDAQKMGFGKTAGHITSFTPNYGAPEQFNRAFGATGPWTDVFALALVAVEVMTGRSPLEGDTLVQLAYATQDPTKRPTPRTFGVSTGDDVEAVFRKAFAVQTADRYQSVGDFWNALRMAAMGVPMQPISSKNVHVATLPASGGNPSSFALGATAVVPPSGRSEAAGAASPSAGDRTMRAPPPSTSARRGRLAAVLVVGAIVAVGGSLAAVALRAKGAGPGPVASASTPEAPSVQASSVNLTASASASAAPAKAGSCPPGMKAIPGGEFFMGSDDKDADESEKPPHKVKLGPYCLDELEVTVAKYKACSDRGACLRAGKQNVWEGISALQQKVYDPLCNANDPVGKAQHPINCVDWEQASTYCAAMGGRLPTEAEWEFAARGSDGRIYPWGDAPPSAEHLNACGAECSAWMKKHPDPEQPIHEMYAADDGYVHTAPVGSFPKGASSWGIQDIVGNVWEWVADWHAPYDPALAEAMTVDPKGPPTGKARVIRGGSWNAGKPAWVQPAWRFQVDPKARTHGIGFRCAR